MNKRGLSLLEIIIATVIFVVIMSGMANVFFSSKTLLAHSGSRSRALKTAMAQLSQVQLGVREDEKVSGVTCLYDQSSCTGTLSSGGVDYELFWTTEPFETNMRRVTIQVHWDE
jgi:prepilin-type N-terminal cleavage/methylation domain-containing protein